MNLTSAERLLIAMELRRQHELEPAVGYDVQAGIIERGYTSLYGEVFGSTAEPELDQTIQEEVFEILGMFRALHPGHVAGPNWNPEGDYYYQKFRGFDGNAGTGHYSFARFLIEEVRRFEESKGELNSHSSTLPQYRAMLDRWKTMDQPHQLSKQQIDTILNG